MDVDEQTIRQLAKMIWETEGMPRGQETRHWAMATKLAESAAMAPLRNTDRRGVDPLFPVPEHFYDASDSVKPAADD